MQLSSEDIWYCKQNGFHIVPDKLPTDLIKRLCKITDKLLNSMEEPIIWERKGCRSPENIRRLSKILSRDSVFLEVATHPLILDALEGILGPNIELLTNKHNHLMVRPPKSYAVPWHSGEKTYNPVLFTALIYLEDSTIENGCIRIVPGSHQRPVDNVRSSSRTCFSSNQFYFKALPVPMPRGGILLFDDRLYHGADINHSQSSRRSMTIAYRTHDAHNVIKDDPEKILVRGERIYTGHPSP